MNREKVKVAMFYVCFITSNRHWIRKLIKGNVNYWHEIVTINVIIAFHDYLYYGHLNVSLSSIATRARRSLVVSSVLIMLPTSHSIHVALCKTNISLIHFLILKSMIFIICLFSSRFNSTIKITRVK